MLTKRFFLENLFFGHKSMVKIFLGQIYVIVLPIQQPMQTNEFDPRLIFGRHSYWKGANTQNINGHSRPLYDANILQGLLRRIQ